MRIQIVLFFLTICISIKSQNEINLYNMDYIPQSQYLNPATIPATMFHLGTSFGFNFTSPFSYNDIVRERIGDTLVLDASHFYSRTGKNNQTAISLNPDVSFGVKILKRAYATIGVREIAYGGVNIPQEFFDFAINGNANPSVIGTKQDMSGFNVSMMHYREFSAGLAYQYNCKWGFGARLKYLIGYQNVSTKQSDISLTTDSSTYALTLEGNYQINSSGTDSASLEDMFSASGNSGFGVDLGATYKYNDKITFSASVLDLGFITWKENNRVIKNRSTGNYVFTGIDIYNLYSNNEDNYLETILDTIKERFDFKDSTTTESYTTGLNTRLYLNASYKALKQVTIGGTFGLNSTYGILRPTLSAFGRADLFKTVQFQLNYMATTNSLANIGFGTALNMGPLQIHFVSDNLLAAFNPKGSKNISLRAGVNFVWSYSKSSHNLCNGDFKKKKASDKTSEPIKKDEPLSSSTNEISEKPLNPDTDGDGAYDNIDMCPDLAGELIYKGCPDSSYISIIESKNLFLFKENSKELHKAYSEKLRETISKISTDSTNTVALMLHSTMGESLKDLTIGMQRSKYLLELFNENGIPPSRLRIINRGYTIPVSKSHKLLNRSVEMKVLKKK